MAASDLVKKGRSKVWFITIPLMMIITTMLGLCLWVISKKNKNTKGIARLYSKNEGDYGVLDDGKEIAVKSWNIWLHVPGICN
ncbi:hypothetical protein ACET3Z_003760 [Daucus carota]